MKNCKLLFLIPAFLSLQIVWAAPAPRSPRSTEPEEVQIKVSPTDSAYALIRILDEELPTVILLPGIYRGFLPGEEILKVLSRRKINWVAWHSSRHPESLIRSGQSPWLRQVSSQMLADELLVLKKTLKIKRPILVTLSYSTSLIPFIDPKAFPFVIETAPMGHAQENTPPSPYYENWKQWMGMFPIFGNMLIQNQEYWAYRGFWSQQTAELTKTHTHYAAMQNAVAEGLSQLAFASRTFDLRNQNFSAGPKRFWILGQKENRKRKTLQKQAIALYEQQTGHTNSAYEIEGAGHVIPNETPEAYVKVVSELVQKSSF